jgi:ferric-dicitrate binding protein FerR (iron transport regulator)
VAAGAAARSGDVVKTGWWGRAVLSVPGWSSRFELYGSTRVSLAGGEPGVLLEVRSGRIRAVFDALVEGSWDRKVAVPGALLAVRGTRYGVEVDNRGRSTLAVFEGTVEVLAQGPPAPPFLVHAGEWSMFGPDLPPRTEPLGSRGFEEKSWSQGNRPDAVLAPGSRVPGASAHGPRRGGGPPWLP